MHKLFADWYRVAIPDPKQETLTHRWNSIARIVEETEADQVLNLARFFLGSKINKEAIVDYLSTKIKEDDVSFGIKDAEIELRIIAGALLVNLIEEADLDTSLLTSIAVISGIFGRKPEEILIPDVVEIAKWRLKSHSTTLRRNNSRHKKITEIKAHISNLKTGFSEPNATLCFNGLVNLLDDFGYRQLIVQEESNILWWLFGTSTSTSGLAFSSIPKKALGIALGSDLSELCLTIPGPIAVRDFLEVAIQKNSKGNKTERKASAGDAAYSVPNELRKHLLTSPDVSKGKSQIDFCPLIYLIHKMDVVTNKSAAVTSTEGELGIQVSEEIDFGDLAYQAFLERILLRMYQYCIG